MPKRATKLKTKDLDSPRKRYKIFVPPSINPTTSNDSDVDEVQDASFSWRSVSASVKLDGVNGDNATTEDSIEDGASLFLKDLDRKLSVAATKSN